MLRIIRGKIFRFAAFAMFLGFALPQSSLAGYGNCIPPNEPEYPEDFASQDEANVWYGRMLEHTDFSSNYLRCLSDYAEANDSRMTQRQKADFQKEYDKGLADFGRATGRWNQVFGKYQIRAARSR